VPGRAQDLGQITWQVLVEIESHLGWGGWKENDPSLGQFGRLSEMSGGER
jgi:hypothetical protein